MFSGWRERWIGRQGDKQFDKIAQNGQEFSVSNEEVSLEQMVTGQDAVIMFIPSKQPNLPSLGFRLGKKIKVLAFQCFGGPIIVEVDGRSIAVGRLLASQIKVVSGGDVI
ncbi:ferrous iron transport protein A [Thermodesulfovibrionales bacterium]|nr:ferrous iron transport protein A [Thermodesulfovibrionales bacterium]